MNFLEQVRLSDLERRAREAGMSLWAYAVHTGRAADIKLAAVYRAMTDRSHCIAVLSRHLGSRHVTLRAS